MWVCHGQFGPGEFYLGAFLFLGILLWEHQYFAHNVDVPGLTGYVGLGVGREFIVHVKSEQLRVGWVYHLSCKIGAIQRIFQRVRANARCKMGTRINFHAKKFTNVCLKGKNSCAARVPAQNLSWPKIPVRGHLFIECTVFWYFV